MDPHSLESTAENETANSGINIRHLEKRLSEVVAEEPPFKKQRRTSDASLEEMTKPHSSESTGENETANSGINIRILDKGLPEVVAEEPPFKKKRGTSDANLEEMTKGEHMSPPPEFCEHAARLQLAERRRMDVDVTPDEYKGDNMNPPEAMGEHAAHQQLSERRADDDVTPECMDVD